MNFWIKCSDNELISIDFQNQRNETNVKCVIYTISNRSICINKSVDFKLPLLIESNYTKHCCFISRQLLIILFQDSKLMLHCFQLDVEHESIEEIFSYNCKEPIQSIKAADGPIISYTTCKYLYIMVCDFSGYFKIYQYNNNNDDNVNEVLYIGKSICESAINQQLIYKNNKNEYKILDIDIYNVDNPILESECENMYKLLNEYKISSLINESNNIVLITNDNKVIITSQDNYNDRIAINCENEDYINYYQPNILSKGYIINSFEIIDIDSDNKSQLLIPNEKIDNLNDIIIVSNCVLYIMNDKTIYITDMFVTKQYNIMDNKMTDIVDNSDVINKVLSSISLKYNEMVENILNNNEIENHKVDLINQIFNRDISFNTNHFNVKYDRNKLNSFIPSTVELSNIENNDLSIPIDENMNNKKSIELKINNCSKYQLDNCEIMIVSNGILYSSVYNIKQQTEHILPSQSIDVQIECNLNYSDNILPSFINIYFNNQYIEYLINYNLSNVVLNHCNDSDKVMIYNKTLLLWKESFPNDISRLKNIKITKMNEKCFKIQYNSNDSQFLLLINKYINNCSCDLYSLLENIDIDSCFDIFSNEINLLKNNNNDNRIDPSQIKTSIIMNNIHKEICLDCLEKIR